MHALCENWANHAVVGWLNDCLTSSIRNRPLCHRCMPHRCPAHLFMSIIKMSVFNLYCTLYKQIQQAHSHAEIHSLRCRRCRPPPSSLIQSVDCATNFDELLTSYASIYINGIVCWVFSRLVFGIKCFNEQFNADNTQYLLYYDKKDRSAVYGVVESSSSSFMFCPWKSITLTSQQMANWWIFIFHTPSVAYAYTSMFTCHVESDILPSLAQTHI